MLSSSSGNDGLAGDSDEGGGGCSGVGVVVAFVGGERGHQRGDGDDHGGQGR